MLSLDKKNNLTILLNKGVVMNNHSKLNFQRIGFFSVAILAFCLQAKEQQGVIELSGKQEYNEQVLESKMPVVVKFYTPTCPACQSVADIYHDLADKFNGSIKFIAIESSKNGDLSKAYNKHSKVPYFQFYDYENGKLSKTGELVGAPKASQLESVILGNMPSMQKKLNALAAGKSAPAPAKRKLEEPEDVQPVAKKQKIEEPTEAASQAPAAKPVADAHGILEIVGEDQFISEVLNSDKPVVVKFYTTWCSPCKMINPGVHELAQRHKGKIKFVFVDADKSKEVHEKYRLEQGVPHFVFYKNGKQAGSYTGGGSLTGEQLEKLFANRSSVFGKPTSQMPSRPADIIKEPVKKIEQAIKAPVQKAADATRNVVKAATPKERYEQQEVPAKRIKSKRNKFGFKRSRCES